MIRQYNTNESPFKRFEDRIKHKNKVNSRKTEGKTGYLNKAIVAGPTIVGGVSMGRTTLSKQLKAFKMKCIVFIKNKFRELVKNSNEGELIYNYRSEGDLHYYFQEIKKIGKKLKKLSGNLDSENQAIKLSYEKNLLDFRQQVQGIKMQLINDKTYKASISDMIHKVLKSSLIGAGAGLAVGFSIVGIKHLVSKKENPIKGKSSI